MLITLLIFQGLFAAIGEHSVTITFLCTAGQVFLFAVLMVLYTYGVFSNSVHLVSQQLLGTQPPELSKMLFTAARLIACSGVASIWIANSSSKQRGGIEKGWSLASLTL